MNPDGKCYVFDDRGSGYARGEGVGVVVLKRLDLAVQDGDPIHAVLAHSGVNHDGRTLGITLPNSDAQASLARSVYHAAGIDPGRTLYVEAHGTVRVHPTRHPFPNHCSS
jgi:acyl transferase domain-containing protein